MTRPTTTRPTTTTSVTTRSETDPPRVAKCFGDEASARHEARWLAQAVHGGVVRLLPPPPGEDGTGSTIETELVPGPTLRTAALTPDQAARALRSAALTLADLHDRGLTHGNLTPDHLLLLPGSRAVVLCSPKGTSPLDPDPTSGRFGAGPGPGDPDWVGLHRCLRWLMDEWGRRSISVPPGWAALEQTMATRHLERSGRGSFRRLARRLDALAPDPPRSDAPKARAGSRGIILAGLLAWSAVLGLAVPRVLASDGRPTAVAEAEAVVDGDRFVIAGDAAADYVSLAVPGSCTTQPVLVVLDRKTGVVWAFDRAEDDAIGRPWAHAEGATGLMVEPPPASGACPVVYATGLAGRYRLDR